MLPDCNLKRSCIGLFFCVGIFILQCAGSWAAMSLEDALVLAYETNPTLLAARRSLSITNEGIPQAYAKWMPSLTLSTTGSKSWKETIEGGEPSDKDQSLSKSGTLSLSQNLYRGGRNFTELSRARTSVSSQRATLSDTEQTVLLEAATAFMNVLRDAEIVNLRKQNIDLLQQRLQATKVQFDLRRRTAADLAQATSRLAEGNAELASAESARQTSLANFEKTIGVKPFDELDTPEFGIDLPKLRKDALLVAEKKHPTILQAKLAVKLATDDLELKEGVRLPTLSFSSSYGDSLEKTRGAPPESDTRTLTSSLTLSIPLYQSGSEISEIRSAKKFVYQRRDELNEKIRSVRHSTVSAWEDLHSNKKRISSLLAQSDAAGIAQKNIALELGVGRRTVQELLDADKEVLTAKISLAGAKRDIIVSAYTLLGAIGKLNSETLKLPTYQFDVEEDLKNTEHNFLSTSVK